MTVAVDVDVRGGAGGTPALALRPSNGAVPLRLGIGDISDRGQAGGKQAGGNELGLADELRRLRGTTDTTERVVMATHARVYDEVLAGTTIGVFGARPRPEGWEQPEGAGGERGLVSARMSRKSKRSLAEWACARAQAFSPLNRSSIYMCATYGEDAPSPLDSKEHLKTWLKSMRRQFPSMAYLWGLEAQRRQAAHYNILIACDTADGTNDELAAEGKRHWLRITGTGGSTQQARGRWGVTTEPVRDVDGVVTYLLTELGKTEQKEFKLDEGQSPGRWWGGGGTADNYLRPATETQLNRGHRARWRQVDEIVRPDAQPQPVDWMGPDITEAILCCGWWTGAAAVAVIEGNMDELRKVVKRRDVKRQRRANLEAQATLYGGNESWAARQANDGRQTNEGGQADEPQTTNGRQTNEGRQADERQTNETHAQRHRRLAAARQATRMAGR